MRQFEVRVVDATQHEASKSRVLDYDAGPDGRAQAEMDMEAFRRHVRGTPFLSDAEPRLELRETGTEKWLDPETFDTLAHAEREGRRPPVPVESTAHLPAPDSTGTEEPLQDELDRLVEAGSPSSMRLVGPPPERPPHPGWDVDPPLPIGEAVHLVFGQCHTPGCGWWAACPEGVRWPKCPICDGETVPPIAHETVRYCFTGGRFFREKTAFELEIEAQRARGER